MTKKFVILTAQTIIRRYYVEVDDPTWAHDGIVMNEMQEYSQFFGSEDVISTQLVEEWPQPETQESVNAAVMVYDCDELMWKSETRWDLAK